jgi:hypothetical protein
MKNNVFIVRTPLQAFNAVEARERFCQNQNNYIIIVYRNSIDRRLLESIVLLEDWFRVNYISLKPHLPLMIFFYKLLQDMPTIEYCFLGDHSTIINYYMNRVKYQKLILLEDGTATIRRAELLEKRVFHKIKKTAYSEKSILEIAFERLLKIDTRYYYNSRFFTIYNLKNSIKIINNDYRFFKSMIKKFPQKKEAFFIGSNIKDKIMVDIETFERYILDIVNIYRRKEIKFYYILHRKEDEIYMQSLSKRLNFKCIRFSNILELEFLKMQYIPCEVSTFLSTAVTTLNNLYPSTYSYYPLLSDDINEKFKNPIKSLYQQFQKEEIVRLYHS